MQSKDCVPSNVEKRKTNSEVPASIERLKYGGVAQLGEHLPCKQGVESSNLFISTEIERFQDGLIAQLVRAHA